MRQVRDRYGASIVAVLFFCCGLLCCGLTKTAQAQDPSASAFEGRPIVGVTFDPPAQPLDTSELSAILPVKPGQTYSAAAIRVAIERLYSTGRYHDIQADANLVDGAVSVTFITRNTWFVGHVSTTEDFAEPPNTGQIVNASRLQLGDPFDMEQIPAAVENIRKLLVQNGYFAPKIEPRIDYDNRYQQANVTFAIQTGNRARYEPPQISGDTSVLNADAIDKATRWHRFLFPGYRGITLSRTRNGIDKIRLKYENSNRLLATVVLTASSRNENNKTGQAVDHRQSRPCREHHHAGNEDFETRVARECAGVSKSTRWTPICSPKAGTICATIFRLRAISMSR